MSLVRFLPAWFHAIADYAVGFGLIIVALAVGGTGAAVATGVVVVGAVVLLVSMLTNTRSAWPRCCRSPCTRRATTSPPRCSSRAVRARLHRHRRWSAAFYIVAGIAVPP